MPHLELCLAVALFIIDRWRAGTVAEAPFEQIDAEIASLREDAAKYRRLAEARRAADQGRIAEKLMELVAELEEKAAELEATRPRVAS
ncbi:MAG TPA: hypothetical protein VLX85_07555 [Stellaceae bacterium]|nr:hypothetical protein [Stellaceae bacterium]